MKTVIRWMGLALMIVLAVGCASVSKGAKISAVERGASLFGTFGTYDGEPRKADGRVDTDRLVTELTSIKAETYSFLVYHDTHDWDDLKLFLPKARANHIKVWVTVVAPNESPPRQKRYSEPFRLDYCRWAVEIARLSLSESNLVAWSIDDFSYDAKIFTTEYLGEMIGGARAINPRLAFVPCMYFGHLKPALVKKYRPFVDGILFPYRHELGGLNLHDTDTLEQEVAGFRKSFGASVPVMVDVYATKLAKSSDSTPEYVRDVMTISHRCADGVMIYTHPSQDRNPAKYQVIQSLFDQWATEKKP